MGARAGDFTAGKAQLVRVIAKGAADCGLDLLFEGIALLARQINGTEVCLDEWAPFCESEDVWHRLMKGESRRNHVVDVLAACYSAAEVLGEADDFVKCAAPRQSKRSITSVDDVRQSLAHFYWAPTLGDLQKYGGDAASRFLSRLQDVVALMRDRCPSFNFKGCAIDGFDRVLVLIGDAGTGTGLHADPCAAINFAVALDQEDDGSVLAKWLFFKPSVQGIELVHTLIKSRKLFAKVGKMPPDVTSRRKGGQVYVARGEVDKMPVMDASMMEDIASKHHGDVELVEQRSGMAVHVPIGWVHAVVNVKPCLKLSFDFVPADEHALARAAVAWHKVVSPLMAQRSAEDYVQFIPRAFQHFLSSIPRQV